MMISLIDIELDGKSDLISGNLEAIK